jgi:coenzyme F420 biosynthesis associated uncharacterized protein
VSNFSDPTAGMVDWDLAVATGTRLVRPGPTVSAQEARAAVDELRNAATLAQGHVADYTGLVAPTGTSEVAVIDRPGWIRANADGFRTILGPVVTKLQEKRKSPPSPLTTAFGSKVTAVETGSLLALLSTKVLGQYELFPPYGASSNGAAGAGSVAGSVDGAPHGRLLLVAPNIVAAEREMGVDSSDFRLWVCLHEETHRVQFGANPWLRDHLIAEVTSFLTATEVDPAALLRRLRGVAGSLNDALRGDGSGESLVEAIQTPEQRAILARVTAVMSLLEGHADVVMDGVGPAVVPSVAHIRERFNRRREDASRPEVVLRRLLGFEAKLRQYRDGARFVRGVVDRVGMSGFNQVWTGPETLPRPEEIHDPAAWVHRVCGATALPR